MLRRGVRVETVRVLVLLRRTEDLKLDAAPCGSWEPVRAQFLEGRGGYGDEPGGFAAVVAPVPVKVCAAYERAGG